MAEKELDGDQLRFSSRHRGTYFGSFGLFGQSKGIRKMGRLPKERHELAREPPTIKEVTEDIASSVLTRLEATKRMLETDKVFKSAKSGQSGGRREHFKYRPYRPQSPNEVKPKKSEHPSVKKGREEGFLDTYWKRGLAFKLSDRPRDTMSWAKEMMDQGINRPDASQPPLNQFGEDTSTAGGPFRTMSGRGPVHWAGALDKSPGRHEDAEDETRLRTTRGSRASSPASPTSRGARSPTSGIVTGSPASPSSQQAKTKSGKLEPPGYAGEDKRQASRIPGAVFDKSERSHVGVPRGHGADAIYDVDAKLGFGGTDAKSLAVSSFESKGERFPSMEEDPRPVGSWWGSIAQRADYEKLLGRSSSSFGSKVPRSTGPNDYGKNHGHVLNAHLEPVITLRYMGDQWLKTTQSAVMSRLPRFHQGAGEFDENSRVDVRHGSFVKPVMKHSIWDPPGHHQKLMKQVDKWEKAAEAKRKLERELVEMRRIAVERKKALAEGKILAKQKKTVDDAAGAGGGKTYKAKDGFLTEEDRERKAKQAELRKQMASKSKSRRLRRRASVSTGTLPSPQGHPGGQRVRRSSFTSSSGELPSSADGSKSAQPPGRRARRSTIHLTPGDGQHAIFGLVQDSSIPIAGAGDFAQEKKAGDNAQEDKKQEEDREEEDGGGDDDDDDDDDDEEEYSSEETDEDEAQRRAKLKQQREQRYRPVKMQIILRLITGLFVTLRVDPDDTIAVVKQKLMDRRGLPRKVYSQMAKGLTFSFKYKELDDQVTLASAGVCNLSTLHVLFRF